MKNTRTIRVFPSFKQFLNEEKRRSGKLMSDSTACDIIARELKIFRIEMKKNKL